MLEWAIFYVLAAPVAIALATYFSVRKMSAGPRLQPQSNLAPALLNELNPETTEFLNTHDFRFVAAYGFHSVKMGIWGRADGQLPLQNFFFSRTPTNTTSEFVTEFSDDVSLTTTKSRAAFMFPRGYGGFIQSFPTASIWELWDAHLKGEAHLRSTLKFAISECKLPYEERISRGIVKQLAYVRSLSFWPIRGIYWFTIKRFLMSNRPIWRQNIAKLYRALPEQPFFEA